MKYHAFGGLLAASLLLTSCGDKKKEDVHPAPAAELTGTWTMIDQRVTRTDVHQTVVFDRTTPRSGRLILTATNYTETTANGSTIDTTAVTYTRVGNTLTLHTTPSDVNVAVQNLTDTDLTFRRVDQDTPTPGDTQTTDTHYRR